MDLSTTPAKTCTRCGGDGPFHKNKASPDGLQRWCKRCLKAAKAAWYTENKAKVRARTERYRKQNPDKYKAYDQKSKTQRPAFYMWLKARSRALRKGIPFTIEASDIVIPERCPLLGIVLRPGSKTVSRGSPTLDRKDSTLGYVKGNVWVISHKANAIKQDASLYELELLVSNLRLELVGGTS